jgi:hypothetical protein
MRITAHLASDSNAAPRRAAHTRRFFRARLGEGLQPESVAGARVRFAPRLYGEGKAARIAFAGCFKAMPSAHVFTLQCKLSAPPSLNFSCSFV